MSVNHSARTGGISFRFFDTKVCCVFSLESPHRGASIEYTQYTILNIKVKASLNYPKSADKIEAKVSNEIFPRVSRTSLKQPL